VPVELAWVPVGSPPAQGAQPLLAGFVAGQPGGPLLACRAAHQNGVHPGKVWQNKCYIGWGGQEVALDKFETLSLRPSPTATPIAWVNFAGGQLPAGAVAAGQEPGRTLGVCRAQAPNGWHPGKVINDRCSIGFGGKEVMVGQFQVLVQAAAQASGQPPGPASPPAPGQATAPAAPVPLPPVVDGIRVVRAVYGLNCSAAQPDVTRHAALACNGKASCSYMVDARVIGDPAFGCAKAYEVNYECLAGGRPVFGRGAGVGPEASGKEVQLSCAGPGAAPQPQLTAPTSPVPTARPAPAQSALPAGSYSQSCVGAAMNGTTLVASCRTASGQMVSASLPNAHVVGGQDIANCNGRLQVGGCDAAAARPQGSPTTTPSQRPAMPQVQTPTQPPAAPPPAQGRPAAPAQPPAAPPQAQQPAQPQPPAQAVRYTRQCPAGTMPNQTNTSCIVAPQCPAGTKSEGGKCVAMPSCPPGGNSVPYTDRSNAAMPAGWCGGYSMERGRCVVPGTMPNQTNTSCIVQPQCPAGTANSGGSCVGAPSCPPGGNSVPYTDRSNAAMPAGWCGGYSFVCVGPGGVTARTNAQGNCP
jgi:hypothetical protein